MKKILLGFLVIVATVACAPQPQHSFLQICKACMTKTQIAEGAVRACPRQVTLNKSKAYLIFSDMSQQVNKSDHNIWVDMFRQAHIQDGCEAVVNKVRSAAPSYEFLKLK
jgi:hypothetical protein